MKQVFSSQNCTFVHLYSRDFRSPFKSSPTVIRKGYTIHKYVTFLAHRLDGSCGRTPLQLTCGPCPPVSILQWSPQRKQKFMKLSPNELRWFFEMMTGLLRQHQQSNAKLESSTYRSFEDWQRLPLGKSLPEWLLYLLQLQESDNWMPCLYDVFFKPGSSPELLWRTESRALILCGRLFRHSSELGIGYPAAQLVFFFFARWAPTSGWYDCVTRCLQSWWWGLRVMRFCAGVLGRWAHWTSPRTYWMGWPPHTWMPR